MTLLDRLLPWLVVALFLILYAAAVGPSGA